MGENQILLKSILYWRSAVCWMKFRDIHLGHLSQFIVYGQNKHLNILG